MGVDLEVMVASQKRQVIMPDGTKVMVYGYRTCPRGESRPAGSHFFQRCNIEERLSERAWPGVEAAKPRFIIGLGCGERNEAGTRVFEWEEGRLVRQVVDGKNCPVIWWDSDPPPHTVPVGFLKKVGKRWHLVKRHEYKANSSNLSTGEKFNRCVEYIDDEGKFRCHYYWHDEAAHVAPSVMSRAGGGVGQLSPCQA